MTTKKVQAYMAGTGHSIAATNSGMELELPDEYVMQIIPISVLHDEGLVLCERCRSIVTAGNYCEICGVRLPKSPF